MKKLIGLILSFFLCCALTCIGCFKDTPILACLSAIASAVLGSVISIIFEAIDSHGQGFHMWYQQLKYRKKEIRLSFSYLFKIQIDGKYLLIKGNRLKNQYQPVGGVYKYYPEAILQEKQLRDNIFSAYWDTNRYSYQKDRTCSYEQVRSSEMLLVLKDI